MKLLGQRNPPKMDSLSCEVRTTTASVNAVWGARLDGMANVSEQLLNTVTNNRPKTLTGLSQKACSRSVFCSLGLHGYKCYRWRG